MKAVKAALFSLAVLSGAAVAADAFAQHRFRHHGAHGGHHGHHGYHGHGGFRFGLAIGVPAFGYGYGYYPRPYYAPYYSPTYYSPYGYEGPVVGAPPVYAEQPQYVERSQAEAPAAEPRQGRQGRQGQGQGSWYFCRDSNAYYPYVQQCASQWERVAPRPQS